ncbi:MAG: SWIM zinc finger family protein [Planctomycetes bacterium]|nr:SWIM zinc finger family protein [Planctomycetota bacterium]
MKISNRLANQVGANIRSRGQTYFQLKKVRLVYGGPCRVGAEVTGARIYGVHVRVEGQILFCSCTCRYFYPSGDICKHIWAVLLAAESKALLSALPETGAIFLSADDDFLESDEAAEEEDWDAAGEEDDEDDPEEIVFDEDLEEEEVKRPISRISEKRPELSKPAWQEEIEKLRREMGLYGRRPYHLSRPEPVQQIIYIMSETKTPQGVKIAVQVCNRKLKKGGQWTDPAPWHVSKNFPASLQEPLDQQIWTILLGADANPFPYYYRSNYQNPRMVFVETELLKFLLPFLARSERFFWRQEGENPDLQPLVVDSGPPWEFCLRIRPGQRKKSWVASGYFRRGEQILEMEEPELASGGFLIHAGAVAKLEEHGFHPWIRRFRLEGPIEASGKEKNKILNEILDFPRLPPLDWPEGLQPEQIRQPPEFHLKIRPGKDRLTRSDWLEAEVEFRYGEEVFSAQDQRPRSVLLDQRRIVERDLDAEKRAWQRLLELGFRVLPYSAYRYGQEPEHDLELPPRKLPGAVRALTSEGWLVEAEGKLYRRPGKFQIAVSSGIDWFEVAAAVDFEGRTAPLPRLLAALRRGENMVVLDDGSIGILPEEWLKKYGLIFAAGTVVEDKIRFRPSQIGLLDILLAQQEEGRWDEASQRARKELQQFQGIEKMAPTQGFRGKLRPYQKEGLGWLHFLARLRFGGCLADDMGLGKTVQVLALLESRRELKASKKDALPPSLVVVPKSLVFNWIAEAARFTPQLRVLNHTGISRPKDLQPLNDHDVILTTYGTLRRDILRLKDFQFDYVILDEAQAIKTASSESAKAARLLQGDHRLALSGTPIENHLGELWSLLDFLNPGILGASSAFKTLVYNGSGLEEESLQLLSRALRPFILRRTKAQVAKDLPEKVEQTIWCDLEPKQRKLYEELRDHYRDRLLGKVESEGLDKTKMDVLQALLRLRQAACHPGLIDKSLKGESSSKLDMLLDQLAEVLDEGHKALVFSQFTSMLAIVRDRIERAGFPYEYLDGRTVNRQERVERFQSDPRCRLFLISLKAGGLGLNLTAAEYVFLLDPWWNPAVEAQAIDRTHRIGQIRKVFAYRLVARQTVEEKVLELQETKRALAEAIINANNSLLRDLTREQLESLLS